jgi:Asp-tRNA(Asn)/Glu-tRNA(Gln) amidotransferase A subunit family amidase
VEYEKKEEKLPENSRDKDLPFGITIFGLAGEDNLVRAAAAKFLQTEP